MIRRYICKFLGGYAYLRTVQGVVFKACLRTNEDFQRLIDWLIDEQDRLYRTEAEIKPESEFDYE